MAPLKDLEVKLTADTSQVDAGLKRLAQAVKLSANTYGPNGRRLTAVDALIAETIEGDARLANLDANSAAANSDAWEAVARDLARQVIDAEAEMDAVIEAEEDPDFGFDAAKESRDSWRAECADLYVRVEEGERAHCETYLEAVRLSEELAWQDSEAAEYRKSTAAARLDQYRKPAATGSTTAHRWKFGRN